MSEQAHRPAAQVLAEKRKPRSLQELEADILHYQRLIVLKPDNLNAHWVVLDCRRKLGQIISQEEFDGQYADIKRQIEKAGQAAATLADLL